MLLTIRNDFHGTEAKVRAPGGVAYLSRQIERRVRRQLCGIAGCKCGGILGERGPQEVTIGFWSATGAMQPFVKVEALSLSITGRAR